MILFGLVMVTQSTPKTDLSVSYRLAKMKSPRITGAFFNGFSFEIGSGGWIRTNDLRVMSPAIDVSYRTVTLSLVFSCQWPFCGFVRNVPVGAVLLYPFR